MRTQNHHIHSLFGTDAVITPVVLSAASGLGNSYSQHVYCIKPRVATSTCQTMQSVDVRKTALT